MPQYSNGINYIKSNEPVSAGVANRPLRQLANRTDAIQGVLDATSTGSCIFLRSVNISPDAVVGSPVYWNEDHSRFELAYAGAEKCDTGDVSAVAQSDCLGLVYKKNSNATADLVLFGVVSLSNIKDFFTGTGRFFLGSAPGTLTQEEPSVAVPLGTVLGPFDPCDDRVNVYVHPEYVGRLLQHVHYKVRLKKLLWAPAEEFDNAPADAVWGYKIESDSTLRKIFPPMPIDAWSIDFYVKGDECQPTIYGLSALDPDSTATEDDDNSTKPFIKIDRNGIWWVYDQVPPMVSNNQLTGNIPYLTYTIDLNFSKVQYSNQKSYVTSLQPDIDQPFEFVNCKGEKATSGDLYARFTLPTDEIPYKLYDGTSVRKWNDDWQQEVVSSVNAISSVNDNAILTSNTPPFEYGTQKYYRGLVSINVPLYSVNYEIRPQTVKLNNSLESDYNGIPYIGLPYGRATDFAMVFDIPKTFSGGKPIEFQIRYLFIAPVSGYFPTLYTTYFQYSMPGMGEEVETNGLQVNTIYDSSDPMNRSVSGGSLFTVLTDPVLVYEGDTLVVTVARFSDDQYPSDAGVVRMDGILNVQKDEEIPE